MGLGLVFSILFGMELANFLPYACAGVILWRLIFGMANEGCSVFIGNEQIIKQINLPPSYHVFRLIAKQFIFFFHHILIFVLVAAIFGVVPAPAARKTWCGKEASQFSPSGRLKPDRPASRRRR